MGRGQWEARLCRRGMSGLSDLPEGTHLALTVPGDDEAIDEANKVVFGAARLAE